MPPKSSPTHLEDATADQSRPEDKKTAKSDPIKDADKAKDHGAAAEPEDDGSDVAGDSKEQILGGTRGTLVSIAAAALREVVRMKSWVGVEDGERKGEGGANGEEEWEGGKQDGAEARMDSKKKGEESRQG